MANASRIGNLDAGLGLYNVLLATKYLKYILSTDSL